jgi:hypothetical protein
MCAFAVGVLPLDNDVPFFNLDPRKKTIVKDPRGLHILLVEDHDDTRRGLESFLRAHGHWT